MDYEKRNKEILEKLRALRDDWASTDNRAAKEIEEAIPELIESEDERIRKEIIDFATKANNGVTSILANNYNFNKWIALLEKKGEQKTVVTIPKFRVGDKIRRKTPRRYDKDMQVTRIESNYYLCNHLGKFSSESISFSEESNYELVEQKSAWSEEDDNCLSTIIAEFSKCAGKSVSKDEWMRCNDFLNSLKERVQHQNMWISVDKEVYIKEPILAQKKDKTDPFKGYVVCCDHTLDPLVFERYINIENISPQNRWKPTESQLSDLAAIVRQNQNNMLGTGLRSLYEDLTKLKG